MRKIVYYVATSIDGYIAGSNEDVSGFVPEGPVVDRYLQDLQSFDTVIMGRKTYEFGYKYGIEPGQVAYPHMMHYIFSNTITFENPSEKVHVCSRNLDKVRELKSQEGTDIYLCGGGEFAGWLLDNQLIDTLKVKLNPLILGEGIRLFGSSNTQYKLTCTDVLNFDAGIHIMTYNIEY